jgi:hypothetical protein
MRLRHAKTHDPLGRCCRRDAGRDGPLKAGFPMTPELEADGGAAAVSVRSPASLPLIAGRFPSLAKAA